MIALITNIVHVLYSIYVQGQIGKYVLRNDKNIRMDYIKLKKSKLGGQDDLRDLYLLPTVHLNFFFGLWRS